MNINIGRVLLGGLVTGIILNAGEVVLNDIILGAQTKAFFAEHNFREPGPSFLIAAVGGTLALGIVIVFGYAAIRPRFGAGPKTAIIAALFAWFGIYLYTGILHGLMFGMPVNSMLITIGWGLVVYVLATLAGAALYKES
ncbi:MAG TPA: hypothetical protein VGW32_06115 [Pyrinomonadaceae bacterium]|nr:hypothetical protein [Pyrinomonadaceae bacterium]